MKVILDTKLRGPVCEDPDDNKFFACAVSSGAKRIVSGDKHLLKAAGYQEIEFLKPGPFVLRYLSH